MATMAQRVRGCSGLAAMELTNPRKDRWRVRWDVQELEDGSAEWTEQDFDHKPTEEEAVAAAAEYYDAWARERILSGFEYEGAAVWLSQENQMNYKVAYDLAVETGGGSLPVTFKLGTDAEPVYREFGKLEELRDFYTRMVAHVQETLAEGWRKKDEVRKAHMATNNLKKEGDKE